MCKTFSFSQSDLKKQIILLTSATIKWNQSQLTCPYPSNPKHTKRYLGNHKTTGFFYGLYVLFPLLNLLDTGRQVQAQICMYSAAYKITGQGTPGWLSGLAPAFGPGRDPGVPGSRPASGSPHGASSSSACVSAALCVGLS